MSHLTSNPISDHEPQTRADDSDEAVTLPPPAVAALPPPLMVPIEQLKPHPRQVELFGPPNPNSVELLVEQLRHGGTVAPIETLADNTILTGHLQFAAYQQLNRSYVPVTIRSDLNAADDPVTLHHVISCGLAEPGIDLLAKGRCFIALAKIEHKLPVSLRQGFSPRKLKSWLAKQAPALASRSLDYYIRLSRTPVEVQHAVSTKKLTMGRGQKVQGLHQDDQAKVAQEIRDGGNPEEVVQRYLLNYKGRRQSRWSNIPKARAAVVKNGLEYLAKLRKLKACLDKNGRLLFLAEDDDVIRQIHELTGEMREKAEICEPNPEPVEVRLRSIAAKYNKKHSKK